MTENEVVLTALIIIVFLLGIAFYIFIRTGQ